MLSQTLKSSSSYANDMLIFVKNPKMIFQLKENGALKFFLHKSLDYYLKRYFPQKFLRDYDFLVQYNLSNTLYGRRHKHVYFFRYRKIIMLKWRHQAQHSQTSVSADQLVIKSERETRKFDWVGHEFV